MSYDEILRQHLDGARTRTSTLRHRARDAAAPPPLLHETLDELISSLEELQVSEEELVAQNETLLAARALLEREHLRYAELFHFAPDPYLVTTLAGALREVNHAAARLLGLHGHAWMGKPLTVFLRPGETRAFRRQLNRLVETRRMDDWDLVLRRRDGTPVEVTCTVAAFPDADPPCLRWALRDTGPRRAAEAAHREAAEARAAARAREEVLAVVSHDLRNPLNAATTATALVADLVEAPEQGETVRKLLGTVRRALDQMTGLVRDLVEMRTLETSAATAAAAGAATDVRTLVDTAAELFAARAAARDVRLDVSLPAGLPPVRTHPGRGVQVLSNLLSNALEHTPPGGEVRVEAVGEDGTVRFTVRDTGCGLDPADLARVFDRYWRRGTQGGLGLGLAIARAVVEGHGGRIWAECEPGHGAAFHFTLPAEHVPAEPGAPEQATPEGIV